jgi:hypothetical protein
MRLAWCRAAITIAVLMALKAQSEKSVATKIFCSLFVFILSIS